MHDEQTRLKANRMVARLILAQIVATAAFFVAVWVVNDRANDRERTNQQEFAATNTKQLQTGCERAVKRDFELLGTNRDLAGFARDAAAARAKDGNLKAAALYRQRESSARARIATIQDRLPGASDPASVAVFCVKLYPGVVVR